MATAASPKRTVWITGASTGIGRALAEEHALKGDLVLATARRRENLAELQQQIRSAGGSCEIATCDVTDGRAVQGTAEEFLKRHTRIDILVNNAGVSYFKEFSTTTTEEFDEVINTNLRGAFLATKAVLPSMLAHHRGLIINIVSFVTKAVYTKSAAYAASKAGLQAMMDVLRAEVRREGIRIVNIYPGAVLTPIWPSRQQETYKDQMLEPRDVARFVYDVSVQPEPVMVEEVVIRPQGGDLHV
jgi:NADP-dependent 3-hydroxy acid dehydrogenase YdfG